MKIAFQKIQFTVVLVSSCLLSTVVYGASEVRTVGTTFEPATPFRYTANGLTHTWGLGQNQIIESFSTDQDTFRFAARANRVELMRDDIPEVSTG